MIKKQNYSLPFLWTYKKIYNDDIFPLIISGCINIKNTIAVLDTEWRN